MDRYTTELHNPLGSICRTVYALEHLHIGLRICVSVRHGCQRRRRAAAVDLDVRREPREAERLATGGGAIFMHPCV